jgi:hypothetical protein
MLMLQFFLLISFYPLAFTHSQEPLEGKRYVSTKATIWLAILDFGGIFVAAPVACRLFSRYSYYSPSLATSLSQWTLWWFRRYTST